jgi:hypothetical protein
VKLQLKGLFSTAIAIGIGVIVLLGFFLPVPVLKSLRTVILQWAVILAAVAALVGVLNLLRVHLNKLGAKQKGGGYSLVLVLALLGTLVAGLGGSSLGWGLQPLVFIFNTIQFPIEASLMALLSVTLLYASIRLLRWRVDAMAVVFIVTALLIFLGTAPLPFIGQFFIFDLVRSFMTQVLATGGARGILIGVALGALFTGLRILLGADRPYGSK